MPELEYCPVCGGEAPELGRLGYLTHYRCECCGVVFSVPNLPTPEVSNVH